MKNRFSQHLRPLTALACILCIATDASAQLSTWSGQGEDDLWSTDLNWEDGAIPNTSDALVFSGTTQTTTTNDFGANTSFAEIRFSEDAGGFLLKGNQIQFGVGGNDYVVITNASQQVQTIEMNLSLGGYNRRIDSGKGGLIISGVISKTGVTARGITKLGSGTLTLSGANTYDGTTFINEGTLIVDLKDHSNGVIQSSSQLYFRDRGGELIVKGAATGISNQAFGNFTLAQNSGASRITVDAGTGAGTNLTLANVWTRETGATDSSLHVDLSSPNSALISNPTLTSGALLWGTVSKGGKTGFITVDAGKIERLAPAEALPSDAAGSANVNYTLSGNQMLDMEVNANTVTISGSGTLSGERLATKAVLLEEGTGNYIINSDLGTTATGEMYIHQYRTTGDLIVNGQVRGTLASHVRKTGSGTLVLNGDSVYTGATSIHEGMLVLNGSLENTSGVTVHGGATLSGTGSATNVSVKAGGALAAPSSGDPNALTFSGSLSLEGDARFMMSLDALSTTGGGVNVAGAVSLGVGAELVLTLGYAVAEGTSFTLIENLSESAIDGVFALINGQEFDDGNQFTLNHLGQTYLFELSYTGGTGNDLTLQVVNAIPEPSSVIFIVAAGLLLFFPQFNRKRLRRARSAVTCES